MDQDNRALDFLRLFVRHEREIYAYILALVPHVCDADDLFQDGMAVMWRKFDQFKPGTSFSAWGVQVMRYEIQVYRRDLARGKRVLMDDAERHLYSIAAVLVLGILILASVILFRPRDRGPAIGALAGAYEAQWRGAHPHPSEPLHAGPYDLREGLVRMDLNPGANLLLEAPCQVELTGVGEVTLRRGTLTVGVSGQGTGFRVRTPTAKVTDLGTEFGVITRIDGSTETHVLKGRVSMALDPNRAGRTTSLVVKEGSAAAVDGADNRIYAARLNGIRFGTAAHPALTLHPNAGITFDLDQIRRDNPDIRIDRFTGVCGIPKDSPEPRYGFADVWVLLDGAVRFHLHYPVEWNAVEEVDVPIPAEARFLTLATTCPGLGSSSWILFGDPFLGPAAAEY